MKEKVITYYLEMNNRDALRPKSEAKGLVVKECQIKQFQFNKFLYQFVGEAWDWTEKLTWTETQWKDYAENDKLRT